MGPIEPVFRLHVLIGYSHLSISVWRHVKKCDLRETSDRETETSIHKCGCALRQKYRDDEHFTDAAHIYDAPFVRKSKVYV